jgi:hypothetical protein
MRRAVRSVFAVTLIALPVALLSQDTRDSATVQRVPHPDSAFVFAGKASAIRLDSTVGARAPTKSTGTAMLLSAIFPGGGQLYNQSYWKVPIVTGLGVYFIAELLHSNSLYKDYRSQYGGSITTDLPSGNPRLLSIRDFYRDQRDMFGWYFLILYVINIADAYVDASLFDFDVGGDLSLRIMPDAGTREAPGPRLGLRVRF